MNCFRLSEKIADYLIGTFLFRLHGFTVALDVRVCDVCVDGRAPESNKTAALLILDEDRVLCGIAFDQDSAACFHSDMPGLPYVWFSNISNVLPMGHEDEACLDDIPAEALERLLDQLNRVLIPQALKDSQPNAYSLKAHLPEEILPSLRGPSYEKLRKKCLIRPDGFPTAYGRAHGLFMGLGADADGNRFARLQVSQTAAEALGKAMAPYSRKKARLSLAERTQQLSQLPDGADRDIPGLLNTLLERPMRTLLHGHTDALQSLSRALSICGILLSGEAVPDGELTYGQFLWLLQRLRREFGEDPELDDWQSHRMRTLSQSLLAVLAEVFIPHSPDPAVDTKTAPGARKSLRQRLAAVSPDALEQLANTPLLAYYQAVSLMTDSGYPNWVYETQIRPLLDTECNPESEYSVRILAAYCRMNIQDSGKNGWEAIFPLLYCLALPECFT